MSSAAAIRQAAATADANAATARQLRAKARSLRALANTSLEPLAVAYRRRAAELELLAAVKGGAVRIVSGPTVQAA